jgi:hypothetical protein
MMTDKLRAAAKAALLALKCLDGLECAREEIENLEAALAETQMPTKICGPNLVGILNAAGVYRKKEWVGLTDEEISQLYTKNAKYQEEGMKLSGWNTFAADVQAKLREKNA